jgi:hypothetical protein
VNDNNYKAPESSLLDLAEPALPQRPRNVNIALGLIGGGVLIRVLLALKVLQETQFQVVNFWPWAIPAAGIVLIGIICHQIAHGRSWARLLLALFTMLVFAQLCWAVGFVWRRAPEMWEVLLKTQYLLTIVLPMAMNMAALHLLYFSSGDWFQKK